MTVKFIGEPCSKCGRSTRYVSSKRCVWCQQRDTNNRYQGLKQEIAVLRDAVRRIGAHYLPSNTVPVDEVQRMYALIEKYTPNTDRSTA